MSDIYKDQVTQEWYFPDKAYILSETDEKGIITYANDVFYEIAGYSSDELLGEPHNIVRHPDMPRIAFQGLWDDIQSKGFWTGFVKNRRKDGGYYWVYATALRRVESDGSIYYLSIRTKPSRSDVDACEKLYAELRESE
ncbi:MAG: PAS domain-containing protein [Campylobacterota bacterium]|nr:PAS domain-containing protein [Campylobacterota bacterium]